MLIMSFGVGRGWKLVIFYFRMNMFRLIQEQLNISNLTFQDLLGSLKTSKNKPDNLPQNRFQTLISYLLVSRYLWMGHTICIFKILFRDMVIGQV